jgi:hypothetical protein
LPVPLWLLGVFVIGWMSVYGIMEPERSAMDTLKNPPTNRLSESQKY